MRVWLPKSGKPPFPLKVELSGVGGSGASAVVTVTKLKFRDRIPQSMFVVPKGYKIRQPPLEFTKPTAARFAGGKQVGGHPSKG